VSRFRNNLCDADLIEYLADCSFCCLAGEFPAGIEFNKARDSSRRVLGAHMLLLMLCSSVLQTECTLVSTILLARLQPGWLQSRTSCMQVLFADALRGLREFKRAIVRFLGVA
jgi:hypothetical protein